MDHRLFHPPNREEMVITVLYLLFLRSNQTLLSDKPKPTPGKFKMQN